MVKIKNSNNYIPKDTLMYLMVGKCSYLRVLEIFFREPTRIHFIKDISRQIGLAHTSVRANVRKLAEEGLILKKESRPFDGYIANRENGDFLWGKMACNILSLKPLRDLIVERLGPSAVILFGSYLRGEDIESSDVDIAVISKVKTGLDFSGIEELLMRKIRVIIVDGLSKLDKGIRGKISNGFLLYGTL